MGVADIMSPQGCYWSRGTSLSAGSGRSALIYFKPNTKRRRRKEKSAPSATLIWINDFSHYKNIIHIVQ